MRQIDAMIYDKQVEWEKCMQDLKHEVNQKNNVHEILQKSLQEKEDEVCLTSFFRSCFNHGLAVVLWKSIYQTNFSCCYSHHVFLKGILLKK